MVADPDTTGQMHLQELPSPQPTSDGIGRKLVVVSLNVWGLFMISKFRHERMERIRQILDSYDPPPDIVGLQECFCHEDFGVFEKSRSRFPYQKYFRSGVFGSGLAILSRWPIEETSMTAYSLNGLPWAFWRGDWYVGKGFARARIRVDNMLVDVFNTHLHAPYHEPRFDFYRPHRLTQAWQLSSAIRESVESTKVSLVIALGDFNSVPFSQPYQLITRHGQVRDSWMEATGDGAAQNPVSGAWSAQTAVYKHGTTCDSSYNTWRWDKPFRKQVARGLDEDAHVNGQAKRLDYVFFAPGKAANPTGLSWSAVSSKVGMVDRHPELKCSLSDHFSVESVLELSRDQNRPGIHLTTGQPETLDLDDYRLIQDDIVRFSNREAGVGKYRLLHFVGQFVLFVGLSVAIFFVPAGWPAFLISFSGSLLLAAGVIDGLMGGLFVQSELSGLSEFKDDVGRKIKMLEANLAREPRRQSVSYSVRRTKPKSVSLKSRNHVHDIPPDRSTQQTPAIANLVVN